LEEREGVGQGIGHEAPGIAEEADGLEIFEASPEDDEGEGPRPARALEEEPKVEPQDGVDNEVGEGRAPQRPYAEVLEEPEPEARESMLQGAEEPRDEGCRPWTRQFEQSDV
jgi:hypothetical protein